MSAPHSAPQPPFLRKQESIPGACGRPRPVPPSGYPRPRARRPPNRHSCPRAGIHPPLPLYMPAPLPVRMVRQAHHERSTLPVHPELVEGPGTEWTPAFAGVVMWCTQGRSCGAMSAPHSARNHSLPPSRNPSPFPIYMPAPLPVRMVRQAHHERAPHSVRPELVEGVMNGRCDVGAVREPPLRLSKGRERSGPLPSQGWSCGAMSAPHSARNHSCPRAGIHPPFLYICPRPFPFAWFDRLTTNGPYLPVRPRIKYGAGSELVEGATNGRCDVGAVREPPLHLVEGPERVYAHHQR